MAPTWIEGATGYHLCALGAAAGGGFATLTGWLDHVAGLGAGFVLLTPVFHSVSHGYDTIDPFRIDPRLGDGAAFDRFVHAAGERGLRVVLDGVFHHVSRRFPAFVDVVERREASAHLGWFRRLAFDGGEPDGVRVGCFEGHRDLVALDHRNPQVLDWAVDVALHWLDRGVAGWRLDVAYAVLPTFWRAFAERVRARHPDALLFGEVIHGDYAGFVESSGLDSVTQYELHKAIWSSLHDANLFELSWCLDRHRAMLDTFTPITFAGNHDVTRLTTAVGDRSRIGHAVVALLTLPGIPLVYYGDELGAEGVKEHRAGGDDAIRPSLDVLPDAVDRPAAELLDLHRRLIELRRARPWLTRADVMVEHVANRSIGWVCTERGGAGRALAVTLDIDTRPVAALRPYWPLVLGDDAGGGMVPAGGWVVRERP